MSLPCRRRGCAAAISLRSPIVIYDPITRQPFAGNVIPPGRIDPIAARFVALYPDPTSPGLANNYSSTTLRTQNSTTADARIDHRFSDTNSVWGRYSINDSRTVTPPGCPPVNGIHGNCLTGRERRLSGTERHRCEGRPGELRTYLQSRQWLASSRAVT